MINWESMISRRCEIVATIPAAQSECARARFQVLVFVESGRRMPTLGILPREGNEKNTLSVENAHELDICSYPYFPGAKL